MECYLFDHVVVQEEHTHFDLTKDMETSEW